MRAVALRKHESIPRKRHFYPHPHPQRERPDHPEKPPEPGAEGVKQPRVLAVSIESEAGRSHPPELLTGADSETRPTRIERERTHEQAQCHEAKLRAHTALLVPLRQPVG